MRYLKGTLDVKLCLRGMDLTMKGYCDADWSANVNSIGNVRSHMLSGPPTYEPLNIWGWISEPLVHGGIANSISHHKEVSEMREGDTHI